MGFGVYTINKRVLINYFKVFKPENRVFYSLWNAFGYHTWFLVPGVHSHSDIYGEPACSSFSMNHPNISIQMPLKSEKNMTYDMLIGSNH